MPLRIICFVSLLFIGAIVWATVAAQPSRNERLGSTQNGKLTASPASQSTESTYSGSDSCKVCHASIYEAWQSTRHSFSVLTGDEARQAGYPLPHGSSPASSSTIRGWNDVAFVFGGRKRVAYVDATGQVQPTSFHPRRGEWSPFPAKAMECGPCHYTGFDPTRPNPRAPRVLGSWAELNIGCEACHGPGARHTRTYDKADIKIDPSSRLCGTCHTRAGRVLPRDDDFHATHDDVQAWNGDPHVTGMKFRSHEMFCARCHSPYERSLRVAAETSVFSESKGNITCISCHNPHALTDRVYRRDAAHLGSPRPPRSHVFKGQDDDVTTENFLELQGRDAVCVQCHTGADRIDLDHADASCSDCHNTFRHNRGRETRIVADATRPSLTCRQCHVDADHLLTLLFRDPDVLRPSYVHNLRTLPASFRAKHGLRYVGRASRQSDTQAAVAPPADRRVADAGVVMRAVASLPPPSSKSAAPEVPTPPLDFLDRGDHHRLSTDAEIRKYQRAVRTQPSERSTYFDLASAYAARGEKQAAADVVERALECPADQALAALAPLVLRHRSLLVGLQSLPLEQSEEQTRLRSLAASIGQAELGSWLQGCLLMEQLQFADARKAFEASARVRPANPEFQFLLGLSKLGQGEIDASISDLQAVLKQHTTHAPARAALGIAYLEKTQFAVAEKELRRAIDGDMTSGTASYALAIGYVRQGLLTPAIDALVECLKRDPDFVEAYFELARTLRLGGSPEASIDVYRRLLGRQPDHAEAHWELANLLKYLFDVSVFRMEGLEGSPQAPPEGAARRALLETLVQQATEYQALALSEFMISLRLRPGYPQAIHHVADLYRRSDRLQQAAGLFEWLVGTQPDEWLYYYRWGTTLTELGEYERAITALTRAAALAPSEGDVYAALGVAHVRAQRLDGAIEMFEKAAVFLPFSPALFTNLGAAYASQGSFEAARVHLRRAVELGTFPLPRLHLTYTNLGLIELRQGNRREAITAFETALHLAPDYARATELLSKARDGSGSADFRTEPFVFNDMLEIFGEISTVVLDDD